MTSPHHPQPPTSPPTAPPPRPPCDHSHDDPRDVERVAEFLLALALTTRGQFTQTSNTNAFNDLAESCNAAFGRTCPTLAARIAITALTLAADHISTAAGLLVAHGALPTAKELIKGILDAGRDAQDLLGGADRAAQPAGGDVA